MAVVLTVFLLLPVNSCRVCCGSSFSVLSSLYEGMLCGVCAHYEKCRFD